MAASAPCVVLLTVYTHWLTSVSLTVLLFHTVDAVNSYITLLPAGTLFITACVCAIVHRSFLRFIGLTEQRSSCSICFQSLPRLCTVAFTCWQVATLHLPFSWGTEVDRHPTAEGIEDQSVSIVWSRSWSFSVGHLKLWKPTFCDSYII